MEQICEFVNADIAKIITDFVGNNEDFDEFCERVKKIILVRYNVYTVTMFYTNEEQVHFARLRANSTHPLGIPSYGFICSKHYCVARCENLDSWNMNHCHNTGGGITYRGALYVERGPPVLCTLVKENY